MPQHPVINLVEQVSQGVGRRPLFHADGGMPAAAEAEAAVAGAPAPPPFGSEQGLVDAALVCLSTGSKGERQHAFAEQLIRQLAALGDLLLPQQQPQAAQDPWGARLPATNTTAAAAAAAAASPAAVQVSVWLRLALLLPLLPLVYKHRGAGDASSSLRGQLLRALVRLLAVPAVRASTVAAGAAAGPAASAAAAAADAAGEPLPQRLLHLLRALLVGGWASWMRLQGAAGGLGHGCAASILYAYRCRATCCPVVAFRVPCLLSAGGKLRDVPPYVHSLQLASGAVALDLPPSLEDAVTSALAQNWEPGLVQLPTCQAVGAAGGSTSSTLRLDPWLLLEGGTGGSDDLPAAAAAGARATAAAVPPWLDGAVKRRRRDLCYWPAPEQASGRALSIDEQLRQRAATNGHAVDA